MFSKKQRIPRETVKKVISEGQKGYSELFLFRKMKNNLNYNRYAVVVSKKVSKVAVQRSIIKRKIKSAIKEILEKKENEINFDIVFIASPTIKKVDHKQILEEIKNKNIMS